eukprot:14646995-Alexandrium_andersonii.AAC.1
MHNPRGRLAELRGCASDAPFSSSDAPLLPSPAHSPRTSGASPRGGTLPSLRRRPLEPRSGRLSS